MDIVSTKAHMISGIWGALASYFVVLLLIILLFAAALIPLNGVGIISCVILTIVPIIIGSVSGLLAEKIAGSRRRRTTFWISFPGVIIGILMVIVLDLSFLEKQDYIIGLNLFRFLDTAIWIVSGIFGEVIISGTMYLYKWIRQVGK